ncbi:carboxypeptidase-like regulatory domain-containing protein [Mucilaginibacter sp. L3T2-6]|uniref:carboxypeptidase-like regulatory domain-containing protein n=1 Tax=Mucilaginibacter sp. L3T2-6 TaxID=3062491 RepID=UPI002676662F|nr:carboxypeptidase-like regulatory domain-containing protein [Mucilaginibacter sp. L3T2-6]
MRFRWVILFFLLLPAAVMAQGGFITGNVTNAETKNAIPGASVFLSNSSFGTSTTESGKYVLNGVRPGQYTLTVTLLGYEDYASTILVGREPLKLDIALKPKPLMLKEVVISSAADWKKNYEAFRKDFIGTDENAKNCVVTNPHVLNLAFNRTKQTLEANSDEFLVVDNKALGYRVKFLLKDFQSDHLANVIAYGGERLFEELPGSAAQKKKWHQKREEAYYGSAMHFFRSLYTNKLTEDGFVMYHLTRQLNPNRPPEDVIRQKAKMFYERRMKDSLDYWNSLATLSKYYKESLSKIPVMPYEVYQTTDKSGIFAFKPLNYLYVVYTKKRDEVYNKDLYRPLDMPNYEVSVVTMFDPGYSLFDMNGIIISQPPLLEGAWAKSRLSDLLPVDYVPDVK